LTNHACLDGTRLTSAQFIYVDKKKIGRYVAIIVPGLAEQLSNRALSRNGTFSYVSLLLRPNISSDDS
jgi:hypothetical protein